MKSLSENIVLSLAVILLGIFVSACSPTEQQSESISLGLAKQPSSALAIIANSKDFFKQQGLDVEVVYYPSGKRALLEGLLPGKVDTITTSDVPYVWKGMKNTGLRMMASLYSADNVNSIIARKDRGINQFSDLKGKTVATQKASAVHFFLHSVITNFNINHDDLNIEFYKAEQLPGKLANGEIDAFSMREPFISQAVELLGTNNSVVLNQPGLYVQNELFVTTDAYLQKNESIVKKMLAAFVQAESYAAEHPEEAIKIVADTLQTSPENLKKIWGTFNLRVELEHSLLLRVEHIAQWMIDEKLTDVTEMPDFRKMVYMKGLSEVNPKAMMMIQ